jgi:nucleoside-diphosphate-sugar epimerase
MLKQKNKIVSLLHTPPMGEWQREALANTIQVSGDIRDFSTLSEIIARYEIRQVYHTAALAKVKSAYRDPLSVYSVNTLGTVALLEACRAQDVDKILILNTDKVYGDGIELDECAPFVHSEPYATSKSCQGLIAKSYMQTYGMNIVMPHSCNIFGYDPYSNRIVPNTVKMCIKNRRPLIYSNDSTIREYIYITDLINALVMLMEGVYQGMYHTGSFNLATGWIFNQKDVVLEILKSFPDLEPRYVKGKLPPQIQEETMSSLRDWDWKPVWSFGEAINDTVGVFRIYPRDWV